MEFEWDQRKASANLRKHGVDFADAATVFHDDRVVTLSDDPDERRYITIGMDALGRVLVVIYAMRGERTRIISARHAARACSVREAGNMKREYDFSDGKRGAVIAEEPGKTRITIRIDNAVLDHFRRQVHRAGGGSYQTLINEALREHIRRDGIEAAVRRAVREELQDAGLHRAVDGGR